MRSFTTHVAIRVFTRVCFCLSCARALTLCLGVFAVAATMNNKQADSEWQDIEHDLDELDLNAQVHGKFSRCLDQVDNTYDDRRQVGLQHDACAVCLHRQYQVSLSY